MMQKQLNSELFGTAGGGASAGGALKTAAVTGPKTQMLEQKLMETRVQVGQLSEQLAHVVSQVNEFIRLSQVKFEKLQQSLQRLENNQSEAVMETAQKLGVMHSRLTESKALENKIQTMVDRHQQVLRSYELRTAQLQKLLAEREADLIETQAALNESKMELMRLKRL
jgi:chromosome segregation ATPase